MFNIELFEDAHGSSPLRDFLVEQDIMASRDKAVRSWMGTWDRALAKLQQSGTRAGQKFTKRLRDDIWELRVGKYRIPFFRQGNTMVLLHAFYKDTGKTPEGEIKRAKKAQQEWMRNHERKQGD